MSEADSSTTAATSDGAQCRIDPGRSPDDRMAITGRVSGRLSFRDHHHWLTLLAFGYSLLIAGVVPAGAHQEVRSGERPSTDEYTVKLSALPEYSQGTYGTGHTTWLLEVPFKGDWSAADWLDMSLTIPYVWIHGRGDVTIVSGRPVRVAGRPPGQATKENGLGDVLAELDFTLLEEKDLVPDITLFVEIKFPTADSSRGLGTGKFDEKIG